MHMHGTPLNVSAANFYSADLDQKIAARRNAEMRKRVVRTELALDADPEDTETLLVHHWLDAASNSAKHNESPLDSEDFQASDRDGGTPPRP